MNEDVKQAKTISKRFDDVTAGRPITALRIKTTANIPLSKLIFLEAHGRGRRGPGHQRGVEDDGQRPQVHEEADEEHDPRGVSRGERELVRPDNVCITLIKIWSY